MLLSMNDLFDNLTLKQLMSILKLLYIFYEN